MMTLVVGSEREFRRMAAHSITTGVAVELYYEPLSPLEGKETFTLRIIGRQGHYFNLQRLWNELSVLCPYEVEVDRPRAHTDEPVELVIRHIPKVGVIAVD